MKYLLDKESDEFKLSYYKANMVGLDITPKNGAPGVSIKAKKIVIVDPELTSSYVKKRINKKIDKVLEFMIHILNDDDTTDGDASIVLDELSRLKGIIINKYKEYMLKEEYKSFLTKIIIIEEEFKKNYNQKKYMIGLMDEMEYEERKEGRSR